MPDSIDRKPITVAAAAIIDKNNRVLISRRPEGTHLAGKWEFPGGKCKSGETIEAALSRELEEELGITAIQPKHLITLTHHYVDKTVALSVWTIRSYSGTPQGREGQAIRWQHITDLVPDEFPAADYGVIRALQLPGTCVITPDIGPDKPAQFLQSMARLLDQGTRLFILRCHSLKKKSYLELASEVNGLCSDYHAVCMLNMPISWLPDCPGANIHLRSSQLMLCDYKLEAGLISASCHNQQEVTQAKRINVDFILLSPVKSTGSHPNAKPLGWDSFADLADGSSAPVYALGGLTENDLSCAQAKGAQGVAGISGFWI